MASKNLKKFYVGLDRASEKETELRSPAKVFKRDLIKKTRLVEYQEDIKWALNVLVTGIQLKGHTYLKKLSIAGLLKFVWPFSGHSHGRVKKPYEKYHWKLLHIQIIKNKMFSNVYSGPYQTSMMEPFCKYR